MISDDIEPLDQTRLNALWLRRFFAHHGPPDVTNSDNGTIYLEWWDVDGDVSLEIGLSKVAILVRPKGGKSWYVNGRMADE